MEVEGFRNKSAGTGGNSRFFHHVRKIGRKHYDLRIWIVLSYLRDKIQSAPIREVVVEQEKMNTRCAQGISGIP